MFALNKTAMFNKYGAEYDELNKETDYFVFRQIKSLLIKVVSYLVAVFFLINVWHFVSIAMITNVWLSLIFSF